MTSLYLYRGTRIACASLLRPPVALRRAFGRRAHFHRGAACSATAAQVVGRLRCPLLDQQPILLQVALDVLPRRRVIALDAHQLRDRLRLRPVDPQLGDRLLEARVQLRRPDEARLARLLVGAAWPRLAAGDAPNAAHPRILVLVEPILAFSRRRARRPAVVAAHADAPRHGQATEEQRRQEGLELLVTAQAVVEATAGRARLQQRRDVPRHLRVGARRVEQVPRIEERSYPIDAVG
mmetsp:Transcript_26951/g.68351  ORF Transcript_26951/g.68351 Transcript_26951/m.68351 type:complete len:237 (+) Transcript_26951:74-784(+)